MSKVAARRIENVATAGMNALDAVYHCHRIVSKTEVHYYYFNKFDAMVAWATECCAENPNCCLAVNAEALTYTKQDLELIKYILPLLKSSSDLQTTT